MRRLLDFGKHVTELGVLIDVEDMDWVLVVCMPCLDEIRVQKNIAWKEASGHI